MINLLSALQLIACLVLGVEAEKDEGFVLNEVQTIFVSHFGDNSRNDCGTNMAPCQTIEHALTLLNKDIDAKLIRVMDELEIQAGSKWNKEFLLEIGSSSPQGISRTLKVDISSSVQKGISHVVCEMEMQLRCLDFCLTQTNQNPTDISGGTFENTREGHALHQQDAPAVILLDSENGNLQLAHCTISTLKHLLEPFEFSFLSAKSGKLSIADLDINDVCKFKAKVSPFIVSEKVNIVNLDELKVEHFILEKCSVFEHPKSLKLKNTHINYCERKNENVACMDCSSSAEDVVNLEFTNCFFQYCTSEDSMVGGALSVGMENPNSILEMMGCSFQSCKGLCGAGLYLSIIKGTVTISQTSFSCEATVGGGGMYVKDANLMKSLTLMEVLFNDCSAENGGGAWIGVGGDEIKTSCWFQNCLFSGNKVLESGADLFVSEGGTKSIDKTIIDEKTFSTSESKRVCIQNATSGDIQERDDLLGEGSLTYYLNVDTGKDDPECGLGKETPCFSMSATIKRIEVKWQTSVIADGEGMMQVKEPINFDGDKAIVVGRNSKKLNVNVALTKGLVANGDGAINVRNKASVYLSLWDINIDTTIETTKTSPFVVSSDSAWAFSISSSIICPSDAKGILNCALFEIHGGRFELNKIEMHNFSSTRALLHGEGETLKIMLNKLNHLETTSATESAFTFCGEWKEILLMSNNYTECTSPNHKKGGAIYIKYSRANAHVQISDERFESCSCTEGDGTGDGSLGGAVFIEAIDEVVDDLNIYLSQSTFTKCVSDVGKWIFISCPKGVTQLTDDCFEFSLNKLYGKENLMIVEERQNKETVNGRKSPSNADRVDLLMPGEHQLIYKSTTLYVGGEGSVDSRDCGRKEKPCQTIECTEDHAIFGKTNSFLVSGMHTLKRSIIPADYTAFDIGSKSKDAATLVIPQALELYCDDVAVIYCIKQLISLYTLSIEYPLHFEHRPVDIILIEGDCQLISITLKPSEEELEAYSNQFSVPFLDFKLIVARKGSLIMTNVVVIGTISEKAASSAIASLDPTLNYHQQEYGKDGIAVNFRKELEDDASVCEWGSCLVSIRTRRGPSVPCIENCVFKNIKEGALLITDSVLEMENNTFENNRPDPSSKAFPHLRHNIHCEKGDICRITIKSLNETSDGSTDVPFGFWNKECDVNGEAVKSMTGLFYTPELKEAAIEKPSKAHPANDNQMDILNKYWLDAKSEESKVIINVKGEYLIPCGLRFEIGKKEGKGQLQWAEVPISEFLNESFLKVKIEKSFLDAKDAETIEVRLRYPNGLKNGVDATASVILKQVKKEDDPEKETPPQQPIITIIIVASCCGGAAVIAAVVVVLAVCVVRQKRRGYARLSKSEEKKDINSRPLSSYSQTSW
ncbi:uncharacterized protein MONOS_7573 [Monocercomonoides exilis]|uniref:uncharacterized protein n=1 Tax=Monocercomonoides exilis TaxID=2049356 RepID=UPI00355A3C04|nr:hypothetical protein MONOS_7573 [Monocercomonoides exilis]|eukprot:MONOS_7573.1-p1 / transcript=MONOS_7573.1 / gene=MONOS_7573 / organism=Monocercomonoides_exilis_PA203 / gene_product=unspecified product / transcript_product=unspecified product / location=Mono_scaffold00262:7731-11873(-) / protein_length=1381 / sequence_SO=supercontig / SO=protein_coding / is_pseudo=false